MTYICKYKILYQFLFLIFFFKKKKKLNAYVILLKKNSFEDNKLNKKTKKS